ncbi:hypothetical protein VPNG_07928 [Cytospora leucostoma]|uniref:F-box domain-containing protein n=1 Tax=Cytospora leucostoma TaxID=1230097 RepID=A0A423WAV5_9PEZI|nr:hypothetical protein VPNG_07928 [Cytospora leucostoma]
MEKLSPEILSLIAGHLFEQPRRAPFRADSSQASTPRAPYACISRKWQAAVEPYIFAQISLKSSELPTFAAAFSSSPYRRLLLRRIAYDVCLHTHGDSRADHARNSEAFGSSMRGLMELLADWERALDGQDESHLGKLELSLGFVWDIDSDADGPVDHNFNVCKSSAARRYLTLDNGDENGSSSLPTVRRVTAFKVDVSLGLAPHPGTMCRLAGLFPNLEGLDLEYRDPAIKRREMRQEHRVALARGLDDLRVRLPRLKRVCIRRQGATDPWDHGFANQDLEVDGVDPLCDSVRQIIEAGTLTELELVDVLLSPDLFRDRRGGPDNACAYFSALRRFMIKVGILAPSGKWYYTGDPAAVEAGSLDPDDVDLDDEDSDSDDSDDEDSGDEDNTDRDAVVNGERPYHPWRTRPDTETFDPLVKSMAEAVLWGMPSLEWGCLEVGTDQDTAVGVIIQCCAAGQAFVQPPDRSGSYPGEKQARRWKAWVGLDTSWHVPEDIMAVWKEWIGEEGKIEKATWPPIN